VRNPLNSTATWRCERCDRIRSHFLRLFSVNSCPKITHLFLVLRNLSKLRPIPSCIKRKVLDIPSVFRMKNLQDAGVDMFSFR
jgi:hypothetical protein